MDLLFYKRDYRLVQEARTEMTQMEMNFFVNWKIIILIDVITFYNV